MKVSKTIKRMIALTKGTETYKQGWRKLLISADAAVAEASAKGWKDSLSKPSKALIDAEKSAQKKVKQK